MWLVLNPFKAKKNDKVKNLFKQQLRKFQYDAHFLCESV